jgi:mitochondrial fission protein ELM1
MKLNIWLILDGKRGHEKQIEDLAFSINKKIKTNITKIKKISFLNTILNFLRVGNDPCKNFPQPDLIIAAGHQTHFDVLQKKNRYGGKIILIMKPSIPSFLFDLLIIPSHDNIFWKKNTLTIDGTVNRIKNKNKQEKNSGLILLGGPSKNYLWSNKEVIDKINNILNLNPKLKFTIATSRRTPGELISKTKFTHKNYLIVTHESVPDNWLENNIGKYQVSWVTQDSISMLHELMASGSIVNLIKLESKNKKFEKLFLELERQGKINYQYSAHSLNRLSKNNQSSAEYCAEFIIENLIN